MRSSAAPLPAFTGLTEAEAVANAKRQGMADATSAERCEED